jgi:hypothetical protein
MLEERQSTEKPLPEVNRKSHNGPAVEQVFCIGMTPGLFIILSCILSLLFLPFSLIFVDKLSESVLHSRSLAVMLALALVHERRRPPMRLEEIA